MYMQMQWEENINRPYFHKPTHFTRSLCYMYILLIGLSSYEEKVFIYNTRNQRKCTRGILHKLHACRVGVNSACGSS